MKTMILSDIHGKAPALEQALKIFVSEGFDRLFLLGDILYHGPRNPLPEGYDPPKVVELINPLRDVILACRGNCDSEVDQMLLKFPLLADYSLFQTENHRFVLTHGHLDSSRLPVPREGDVLLSGHTHIPVLEESGGIIRFNPGSPALPKGGNPPSYGVIEGERLSVRRLDTGKALLEREA
ncbi:MAG: phosphodiesterase [Spirochaetales bacterium]|nr:phosphodiesterase [Spirochaetales bacterium]